MVILTTYPMKSYIKLPCIDEHKIRLEDDNKNIERKFENFSSDIEILHNKSKDQEWSNKLHSELLQFKAEKADIKKGKPLLLVKNIVERMLHSYVTVNRYQEFQAKTENSLSERNRRYFIIIGTMNEDFVKAVKTLSEIQKEVNN